MISFIDRKPLIHPSLFIKKKTLPPRMIVSWAEGFKKVLEEFEAEKIISRQGYDIWLLEDVSFAIIPIGAPFAAMFMEEMKERGVEEFLFIGSCGSLVDPGTAIIVPDRALRDEGTSYHYIASKEEFITVQGCEEISTVLDELSVPYVKGSTWTTDAVYRETEEAAAEAREKGCICVDMECSAIMAVAQYAKIKVRQLFFTADRLKDKWNEGRLFSMKKSAYYNYLKLALFLIKKNA
ncbi:MAG: nucleoside phosphorylase [Sphaerochaetaceae bacterium]|nr:nucleoside phosphorylase [Sphaerochaetaceae bacterium]